MSWGVEERGQHRITCELGAKLSGRMPPQMPCLLKQLHQIKDATLQVRPAEDDRVTINRTTIQTLNHVWGFLELIFYILQVPAFCQSDRRTVPHEHLKNSTVEGQSNGIARVAFYLISMKQVQLRISMT